MNEMYEAVIEWLRIHTIQILCVHIGCVLCVLFVFWYAVNANSTNSIWILNAQFEGGRVRKTKNNWNVYIFLYSIQFEITGCVHWAMHNATCVHHKQRYHIYWYLCWCVNATSNKKRLKAWRSVTATNMTPFKHDMAFCVFRTQDVRFRMPYNS